jgi:uncharacterized SAM-binding protein YcdF (DUF218 family)
MLRMADRLPANGVVDAIYVPGFCLKRDKKGLTALNTVCMEEALRQMRSCHAKHLIISGCYDGDVMEEELRLRRDMANRFGFGSQVHELRGITNTDDELQKLRFALKSLGAYDVLFVSDQYHMPRLVRWAERRLPETWLFHVSVRPESYDFAYEPSLIKTLRSGIKPLWILWNVLLYFATPLLLR